jgi:hypothetical protein
VVLMNTDNRWLGLDEAASACGLDALVIRYYAELGVIKSQKGYGPAEVAELRRARRLMHDLELEPDAIAIILRMRRRVLALQAELHRLENKLRATRQWRAPDGIEAEWRDLEPE